MANWDLLIKNATIFDGTGAAPQKGDLAVKNGKVAARGEALEEARAERVVEAGGKWLMPGLLDIHTHYDLEVELEPGLKESVRHGTTTVVMSNCSLGLAFGAQRRDGADPIVDCFARVENMPKHVLEKAAEVAEGWDNSADYLRHLDELALGANVVPMIPHSMLRIEVMGLEDSIARNPTSDEIAQMRALVEKGMREGYVGFSTDALPFHYLANDPNRRSKIPTQYGTYKELKELTGVVREYDGVWQATPPKDSPPQILRNFLLSSARLHGKPLRITAVAAMDIRTNRSLGFMGRMLTRVLNSRLVGGKFRLQALAAPFKVWSEGPVTPLAEEIPELRRLNEPDLEDREARMRVLADPKWREQFREMWYGAKRGFGVARIKRMLRIEDHTLTRELADMIIETCPVDDWHGLPMQEVYERLGAFQNGDYEPVSQAEKASFEAFAGPVDDADFFLELLRQFDMDLYWYTYAANIHEKPRRDLLMDPQILPGFSDSGAHITNMAFYDVNLRALQIAQKESLELVSYTVKRLTSEPADFFGLDCGRIDRGQVADLTLVDPEALRTYDAEANIETVYREAFEHHQLVNRSEGVVPLVVVGGKIAFEDGEFSSELGKAKMGRALRNNRLQDSSTEATPLQAAAE